MRELEERKNRSKNKITSESENTDHSHDEKRIEKTQQNNTDKEKKPTLLKIYVTTSNLPNAGTNANVFLQLYKTKRITNAENNNKKSPTKSNKQLIESLKFPLEHLKSSTPKSKKKFQPGHTDLFEIEDQTFDVEHDELERIRVSTDAKPFVNAGWHLKRILIRVPVTNREYLFECSQWLDALEAKDKKTQRDLYPSKMEKEKSSNKERKKLIDFETDDKRHKSNEYDDSSFSSESSRSASRHSSRRRSKK